MQPFPHRYRVTGSGRLDGDVALKADGLTVIRSASPPEFGGPGDQWSPESLLVAAVADCFILTFRAVANASRLSWLSLDCHVTGTLDRVERVTQFTHFEMHARLVVPEGVDADRAKAALDKAERSCLITSSLKATVDLAVTVEIGDPTQLQEFIFTES
jgi:organic hydroperoxide reductase OsmC/OhrA